MSGRGFAIIDDGSWRGVIAPKSALSQKRLAMLIDDLEDTDPEFLEKAHKEYKRARDKKELVSSTEVEEELSL